MKNINKKDVFSLIGGIILIGATLSYAAYERNKRFSLGTLRLEPSEVTDAAAAIIFGHRGVFGRHYVDNIGMMLPSFFLKKSADLSERNNQNNVLEILFSLKSVDPINYENGPKTSLEEEGLTYVKEEWENYYAYEETEKGLYFYGFYPDLAVALSCTNCHNNHPESPKRDYEMGEVMGGLIVRMLLVDYTKDDT